jgi:Uma2 family endonuclease
MTAEELERLGRDGRHRYELVRGELVTMAPAGYAHGNDATEIAWHLRSHVRRHGGGQVVVEVGFILARDPDVVRAPDVAYVDEARVPPPDEQSGFFQGAPDIAVEVLSPGQPAEPFLEKLLFYLAHGVRLVWVVNPVRETVLVLQPPGQIRLLTIQDTLDGGDVLPGFSVPLAELFAPLRSSTD